MLSLVHVLEWRAAVQPDQVALSDDVLSDLGASAPVKPFWAGRDRRV